MAFGMSPFPLRFGSRQGGGGIQLGPELFDGTFETSFDAPWAGNGTGTYSIDGSQATTKDALTLIFNIESGDYRVQFNVTSITGTMTVFVGGSSITPITTTGVKTIQADPDQAYLIFRADAGAVISFTGLSVKLVLSEGF